MSGISSPMLRLLLALSLATTQAHAAVDGGPGPSDAGVSSPQTVHGEITAALHDPALVAHAQRHLLEVTQRLQARLSRVDRYDAEALAAQLRRFIAQNLAEKRMAGFPLDANALERQVIDAEAFKLQTFVTTGVFPKRYFGYLDERWDTAAYETKLKATARASAKACNAWLEHMGEPFRVTEQELIVTFLAEGGAILLRENQRDLERIHPVLGIGLDDIAKGFADLEPLVKLVDASAGTSLASIVVETPQGPALSRMFHFEEAVAGTAVMWVWEKRIAESKLRAAKRPSLAQRTLPEQFVVASLVYNSGVLFNEASIASIRDLDTGSMLFDLSERTKTTKWPLPVLTSSASLRRLLGGENYPEQLTSWSAAYHVLQRYGGYVGLSRHTDAFDELGALRTIGPR